MTPFEVPDNFHSELNALFGLYSPIRGIASDVAGSVSLTIIINTVSDSKTVTPVNIKSCKNLLAASQPHNLFACCRCSMGSQVLVYQVHYEINIHIGFNPRFSIS